MRALSSYWARESIGAFAGSTSVEKRLAIALTPIRSIIRVIDDNHPPMTADWAQVGTDDDGNPLSMSYTDFEHARIAVNPVPILEDKLSKADQIDVCVGFACHEASHAKHSRDRWQYLVIREDKVVPSDKGSAGRRVTVERPAFSPMRVAAWLWNIAEDIRIEDATSREWPGFAAYFDRLLSWLWGGVEDHGIPGAYGPAVSDKLKIAFLACRFPDQSRQVLPAAIQPEVDWWSAWQHDYLAGTDDVPTCIQRGLDHLAEDEQSRQELEQMAEGERRERERGERLRDQIERLIREGIAGAPTVCVGRGGELDERTADRVYTLVDEELTAVASIIPHDKGKAVTEVRSSKPHENAKSRTAYVGRPDAATEALRAALVFRNEAPEHDVKLQRRGQMDDEEVWRWATGDWRLFSERVVQSRPDTLLGLLVDLSGSMLGGIDDYRSKSKLEVAQRLAQLFVWATADMEGVTTRVWGHTGDSDAEGSDIYRLYEPGDPLSRLGLISTLPHGNNYDGHAIAWCADRMRREEQEQKVLIVLSDGYPAGAHYGGREAEHHMAQVCGWARNQGVEVIQIAIDEELRPIDQARMFGEGNWVPFESEQRLPRQLTALLGRYAR